MSEFGGGSSEVSESTEVNETPPEETGGESSEATQEAATEEANESGGFDDTEHTEAPDSNEDTEDMDSEDDDDESQDVGFEDGDDVENTDSQPDNSETYEDDNISDADEDQVGFDDSDEIDDGDIEDKDPEVDPDDNEADEDPDRSSDGDPDGDLEEDTTEDDLDVDDDFDDEEDSGEVEDYSDEPEDDTVEDNQDVNDDGDIQNEDPEADPDGNEADEDPEGSPDGNPDGDSEDDPDGNEADEDSDGSPDGDPEDDAIEDDQDVDDNGDLQDEDPEADPNGNEADEDSDGSPDDDPDGDPEDDSVENDQDVADDGDIQKEDPEADLDGNEADEDPDGSPNGDPEDDAIEDDQDVADDGDLQDEDPETDPNGNEADKDPDGSPDGDPEGNPEDDTIEGDQDMDDDFDDEEDTGELEDYSDDPENNADSTDEADDEAERDQDKEELAEEKANEEAAEEAEHAVSEDANKLAEDEADPVEDENQKLLESQPEDSAEKNESGNKSDENGHMDDTPEEENKPEADIDSESEDDLNDELEDSEEYQDEGEPENYDDEKPVDPVSDTKNEQETPSETDADDKVSKTAEESEKEDAYRTAMNNMADYLNSHNYGREDYAEYSKDPEWQKLNADLQRSLGMEVTTDVPETSTTSPEGGKEVSSTELPDNCVVVNASDIDMTYAQGMDSDQFWNHHGNTKEDYMRVAEKLPDVQQALDSGKSIDELKNDPELGETVRAYYDPDNMIKVEQQPDGSYSFTDDGRHRIAAAQELGYEIPVDVTNVEKPVDSQSNTKISDSPSDSKNNLDGGDGPDNPPPPSDGGDGPDNPPPPPDGGDGPDNPPPPPDGGDGPGGPPEKEFGKEQLNVAAQGDSPSWVKSSDIKNKLDAIGRPDLSAKVDEAISKLKTEAKASEEFVSVMQEAGNELCKNEDTVDCGNALLNLVDKNEQALKVETENGAQEYNGLEQENNERVEGASEAANPEDLNRKQDIGSETRENLGSFEQSKWDNLSQVEKEQAVEKLRDSIAEDLQLENKPNIAYYYKESPSDFGGYAASTNTIYINRFNMDNAGETADTIAHESRHCWQHERAENPQTEQDYKFKENFEDYVRPEDDYRAYKNQIVESDARDYAASITDLIPENNTASYTDNETVDKYVSTPDNESSRAPPEGLDVNSKTLDTSDLPADFESKEKAGDYSTKIDDKVEEVEKEPLPDSVAKSFKDGKYRTVVTTEPITLYRVYGGENATIEGSYCTTEPCTDKNKTRNDLALKSSWGNTMEKEAEIVVPAGTKLNIGRVEEQSDGGKILTGNADQILLPEKWNQDWVKKVRDID